MNSLTRRGLRPAFDVRFGALMLASMLALSACNRAAHPAPGSAEEPTGVASPAAAQAGGERGLQRHVTKTAHLEIEVDDPARAETIFEAMAAELGGYVADSTSIRDGDRTSDAMTVHLAMRVPAERFAAARERVKTFAARVVSERLSADDVTEEFVDVNAHLAAEKALEAQFLEVLKQARTVKDALEVHAELARVRTEIEKLEGRRRWLEGQTAMATLHIAIEQRAPVARAGWRAFADTFEDAGRDAARLTMIIAHGTIRFLGVAIPLGTLVVVPLVLLARAVRRRTRRPLST